jgi:hypothetical protein
MHGVGPKYTLRNLLITENRLEEDFGNTEIDDY